MFAEDEIDRRSYLMADIKPSSGPDASLITYAPSNG
jgi:hypothetical protein